MDQNGIISPLKKKNTKFNNHYQNYKNKCLLMKKKHTWHNDRKYKFLWVNLYS